MTPTMARSSACGVVSGEEALIIGGPGPESQRAYGWLNGKSLS